MLRRGEFCWLDVLDLQRWLRRIVFVAEALIGGIHRFTKRERARGGGQHRKSDYEVLSEWQDVEDLIAKFCEAGHPEALAVQEARQLAAAVKGIGWKAPDAARRN